MKSCHPGPAGTKKREQILKVAGELFMKHGFTAVTMDAIAESAPVSKPTLYNHFKNKTDLFFAVIEQKTDALSATLKSEIKTGQSVEETLKNMAHKFLNIVLHPDAIRMHRVMIAESGAFPELGKKFYESGPRKITEIVAHYLEEQHKNGQLNVPSPQLSANFFINMIKGSGHMQMLMGIKNTIPPKERAELVDYATSVFLSGHHISNAK